jgi:hypothetical protein
MAPGAVARPLASIDRRPRAACLPLGIPGPPYPPLDAGLASQPGDQAATNMVLKAKSLSLTGFARVLPCRSTMVVASPDVSGGG